MDPIDISRWKLERNVYLAITVGADFLMRILSTHGVGGWNQYVERLLRSDIFAPFSSPGDNHQDCEPVILRIDLSGADLRGMDLRAADLTLVELEGADLSGADLSEATLSQAERVRLVGANLTQATFNNALISGADFAGARLVGTQFRHTDYNPLDPPRNLPDEFLSLCRPIRTTTVGQPDTSTDFSEVIRIRDAQLRSFWWTQFDHGQEGGQPVEGGPA